MTAEDFLEETYRSRNDSEMQEKLRTLKPFPVTAVYWQQRDHDMGDIREHFRKMREVGITGLKGIHLQPDADVTMREVRLAAIDEGLVPWFYGKAGWDTIDDDLCEELGIDPDLSMQEKQEHPKMQEYQAEFLRERVEREDERPDRSEVRAGEPPGSPLPFDEDQVEPFADWLRETYGDLESLRAAWNDFHGEDSDLTDFETAAREGALADAPQGHGEFRRHFDAMRYAADAHAAEIEEYAGRHVEWDPEEPMRTGGHNLFFNHAAWGWDLETQAATMAEAGSFYNSIHLVHHFGDVGPELDRPVYMQARLTNDFFKGGWSAPWESTGGPAVYSGTHGAGADDGVMTRLLFNYIAGGCRGVGLWCWNPRDIGWEVGEYALVDRQGELTDRARRVGEITDALQEHRFELWEAHNQPQAGVLFSWITDALYGRLALGGYEVDRSEEFPRYPRRAQIGASRALINEHVPYEYVTERDLAAGLADRYETIYLPHVGAFRDGTMEALAEYVEGGGRVVADMMCGLIDEWSHMFDTSEGSPFERVFGLSIGSVHDANNMPRSAWGKEIEGTFADVKPTTAEAVEWFEPTGEPAVLENEYGDGSAAFVGFEASRMCKEPGNAAFEGKIAETVLGNARRRWISDVETTYRLAAPEAHHYLFSNGGSETTAHVVADDAEYTAVTDAVTGETLAEDSGDAFAVDVPGEDGRWVRAEMD